MAGEGEKYLDLAEVADVLFELSGLLDRMSHGPY
jgi:hypothetical protein